MKIKVHRSPDSEYDTDFEFKTRFTILLGWNGAGKTSILNSIYYQLGKGSEENPYEMGKDFIVHKFSPTTDIQKHSFHHYGTDEFMLDGLRGIMMSEGEAIAESFAQEARKLGKAHTKAKQYGKRVIVTADQLDSGWSYDRLIDVVEFFDIAELTEEEIPYFLISANSFELASLYMNRDDATIIWVPTMEEIKLTNFEDFIKMYMNAPRNYSEE